ncbi:SRPBCC domain-containing protein [Alkalihalobacillus sp. MEB130]|uniref:SRPBCC family protein n=1 Tax=Alkalihalobacillus sp. MEB130 TaxID=2976704 RepID=UPI0028E04338|nr:SRPBCC domain-containing protein [Alkalihalobacillus sp. MEB130]MDT8861140.1 SRPBCC domain-containing protein [Alkalihalobacillus sp. MEB130]
MDTLQDIRHTVVFKAPIKKVWNAISTSSGIESWFMPNDFELKVGQDFHLQSPFGPSPCKVLEVNEPTHISFSWDTDGWIVTFSLKELQNQTEFTLVHSGWKSPETKVSKANEKHSVIRERMDQGWDNLINEGLRKVVEA